MMIHPDVIRNLYDYHFALNRKIWHTGVLALTDEQFLQPLGYSVGSVRNQVVHLINIDERWFSGLRGVAVPDFVNYELYPERAKIREYGDRVEANIRAYLATLTEEQVNGNFEGLEVWRILLHVANHGTDHRAQLLSILHGFGVPTTAQDYFLWHIGRV